MKYQHVNYGISFSAPVDMTPEELFVAEEFPSWIKHGYFPCSIWANMIAHQAFRIRLFRRIFAEAS